MLGKGADIDEAPKKRSVLSVVALLASVATSALCGPLQVSVEAPMLLKAQWRAVTTCLMLCLISFVREMINKFTDPEAWQQAKYEWKNGHVWRMAALIGIFMGSG